MAKKSAPQHENTAAAYDRLSAASGQIGKDADSLKARIDELADENEQLSTAMLQAQTLHEREVEKLNQRYERDVTELKNKLAAKEDIIRRVQGHING